MRELFRWTVFPVVLVVALVASTAAMARGVEPALIMLPAYLILMPLVALLERLLPFRRQWNHSQGDLATDALYLPTTFGVGALSSPVVASLAVLIGGWLSRAIGMGLWPTHWPLLAQVLLACVVAEFFDYWAHRAMHESRFLWRFHTIHHSAPRLYFLNGIRTHPGEALFRGLLGALPLAVLGVGEPVLALWAVVGRVAGLFQHANIDFELGPLSWIFSIGELHRWHHSRDIGEANTNYGNSFIFWDTAFGTRYLPERMRCPRELGIEGLDGFPSSYLAQLVAPFRLRRIRERSLVGSG